MKNDEIIKASIAFAKAIAPDSPVIHIYGFAVPDDSDDTLFSIGSNVPIEHQKLILMELLSGLEARTSTQN